MTSRKCVEVRSDKIIPLKEKKNKSKFRILNEKEIMIEIIKVDNCLITGSRPRCDWIVLVEDKRKAMYVELKGCDIDRAILQLASTLDHTRRRFKDYERECFVVSTRVPRSDVTIRKKKIDFMKKNGVPLKVKNIVVDVCV